MIYLNRKKAAIELSMTTIIVVVLSLTLLILGFVFIRSIMCSAIGFTEDINSKVEKEVQRLFETSGGVVVCIGSEDPVSIAPGGITNIYCSINAREEGIFSISVESIEALTGGLQSVNLNNWVIGKPWQQKISPGDDTPQKPITLNIPDNAPEGVIRINLRTEVKDTQGTYVPSGPKVLDFKITRTGAVRNVLC